MFATSVFAGLIGVFTSHPGPSIEGITFAGDRNSVYVPVKSVADSLGLSLGFDSKLKMITLDGNDVRTRKHLYDGTKLVELKDLVAEGAQVEWTAAERFATVSLKDKSAEIIVGPKKVVVDLAQQQLDAYQGDLLVFTSHVSTGRAGKNTPPGEFKVGPKQEMHHSKLYDNAPMPWSVQVNGNVFIHGFKSVPKHPASHGCIRVPLRAAHWFYGWVEIGTPVSIVGKWDGGSRRETPRDQKQEMKSPAESPKSKSRKPKA